MLKRPEVWILIVLAAAGSIWFAFFQEPADELAPPIEVTDSSTTPPEKQVERAISPLELLGSMSQDSGDHWVIELKVRAKNPTDTAERLESPFARLLDSDGSEVRPFYLPFAETATLAPNETAITELRYFLPKGSTDVALTIGEQRLALAVEPGTGKITRH